MARAENLAFRSNSSPADIGLHNAGFQGVANLHCTHRLVCSLYELPLELAASNLLSSQVHSVVKGSSMWGQGQATS